MAVRDRPFAFPDLADARTGCTAADFTDSEPAAVFAEAATGTTSAKAAIEVMNFFMGIPLSDLKIGNFPFAVASPQHSMQGFFERARSPDPHYRLDQ